MFDPVVTTNPKESVGFRLLLALDLRIASIVEEFRTSPIGQLVANCSERPHTAEKTLLSTHLTL
ncbi:MAG: hypothetical protein DMG06_29320 [Acidobacteria bacterium]|nr:MAG: hypothetical protein DMG06_29320 [Acidobacteriota bacterium]